MYSLTSFAKCMQSCNYIHKVQNSNHSRKFLQVNSYSLPALEISDLFSVLTILSFPGCLINRINLGSLIQYSTLQTNSCFCMYHQFLFMMNSSSIPLCGCIIIGLPVHQLKDIWLFLGFGDYQLRPLLTFSCGFYVNTQVSLLG